MSPTQALQVGSNPVEIPIQPGTRLEVENVSGGTLYYGKYTVSATVNEGSLVAGEKVVLSGGPYYLVSAGNTKVEISYEAAEALGQASVTSLMTQRATVPAKPAAEGEQAVGLLGTPRCSMINWNSKKEAETKKLKHGLATADIASVTAYKANGSTVAITSWSVENANEIAIKWAAEPTAKEEFVIVVVSI